MKKNKTWFAVLGITPLKGNEILRNQKGAYINVACVCKSELEFRSKLKEIFAQHRFEIFEIENIESEEELNVDNPDNAEKLKLLDEIKEGYTFAWGTFHVFKK